MSSKLFYNCRIYTPVDNGKPAAGSAQSNITRYNRGALFVENGVISKIGSEKDVLNFLQNRTVDQSIDCKSRCMIPGFVDPHTHMCFAAERENEFQMRLDGMAYLDILKQGGGILSSVNGVKKATTEELYENCLKHALKALSFGTTTVEIKSGYGLDTENELKMLSAIGRVGKTTPQDVVATFLGAHAIPPAYKDDPDAFIDLVIGEMLPAVDRQGIAT